MKTFLMPVIASTMCVGVILESHASQFVDLAGPATGYLAISNFKNSSTAAGIVGSNGLPDYANYQLGNGNWTSIIASPLDASSDYSAFANFSTGFTGTSFAVSNQTITQADASTLSAGQIEYDNALVSGVGTEIVAVGDLTFDFDTFDYDGSRGGPAGFISPFSPIYTPYNDGSGNGNASVYYNLSVANIAGTGLTFVDGDLDAINITADLTVQATSSINPGLTAAFTGSFTASGSGYTFAVNQQQDFPFIFSDVNMVMNRQGTAVLVPEPASALLLAGAAVAFCSRRQRRDRIASRKVLQ